MYLPRNASRARLREARNARDNRAEIVKALSHGQVTRRELVKWGIFTAGGLLVAKSGLSPFAKSALAHGSDIPTGTPRTPLFGVEPFTQPMPRLLLQDPKPLTQATTLASDVDAVFPGRSECSFPSGLGEAPARWASYHSEYDEYSGSGSNPYENPVTGRGPCEGRPPGEYYAHQRWDEYAPQVGYQMCVGEVEPGIGFHPGLPAQSNSDGSLGMNALWSLNALGLGGRGTLPPPLIKARYGEPFLARIYNNTPVDPTENGGFGRNETNIHFHNAHNGAESDGANNAHFFPGTFYDFHWSTTMARADEGYARLIKELQDTSVSTPSWHGLSSTEIEARAGKLCTGPDGNGGLTEVPGDFREIQGTMWAHDHRFFFTAENVYKGNLMMISYYSGPDRGYEGPLTDPVADAVNLRLPSGTRLDWGNVDFDVNLLIADWATDQDGQYFFDIFDTDGFLGDNLHVNFAYAPVFEVLPRKYRFRILNACMSRFLKLMVSHDGNKVPFQFIANDGNLVVHPLTIDQLDEQGVAERYDIVVDFSRFSIGEEVQLVNVLEHEDGRKPDGAVSLGEALNGKSDDPAVGPVLEFRIVGSVESVDEPGYIHHASHPDISRVPNTLTEQIPIVEPVRERVVEWTRGGGEDPSNCFPECGDKEEFPWSVTVNGEKAHTLNANRISNLIPRPGEVEHWTYINEGGGWDHPIHLHFEEGVTMSRPGDSIPATEYLVRKDVWRLRPDGKVKFQVRFGEYGGAYVNHCHNTVHEDNAMLMRYDILTGNPTASELHASIIPTPDPSPDGVTYRTPEILPEGDPSNPEFFGGSDSGSSGSGSSGSGSSGSGSSGSGSSGSESGKKRRRKRRRRKRGKG